MGPTGWIYSYGVKGGTEALYTALEKKTAGAVRGSISNVTMSGQNILLEALNDPEFKPQQAEKSPFYASALTPYVKPYLMNNMLIVGKPTHSMPDILCA